MGFKTFWRNNLTFSGFSWLLIPVVKRPWPVSLSLRNRRKKVDCGSVIQLWISSVSCGHSDLWTAHKWPFSGSHLHHNCAVVLFPSESAWLLSRRHRSCSECAPEQVLRFSGPVLADEPHPPVKAHDGRPHPLLCLWHSRCPESAPGAEATAPCQAASVAGSAGATVAGAGSQVWTRMLPRGQPPCPQPLPCLPVLLRLQAGSPHSPTPLSPAVLEQDPVAKSPKCQSYAVFSGAFCHSKPWLLYSWSLWDIVKLPLSVLKSAI